MAKRADGFAFTAAFAPGRKCFQADTEGEVLIQLVIPESDTAKALAAYQVLRDRAFRVTLTPTE